MIGKFSIRIVPNQTPEIVEDVVVKYCNKVWSTRKSPNKMTAKMFHGGRCWLSDPDHPNYIAGSRYCVLYCLEDVTSALYLEIVKRTTLLILYSKFRFKCYLNEYI